MLCRCFYLHVRLSIYIFLYFHFRYIYYLTISNHKSNVKARMFNGLVIVGILVPSRHNHKTFKGRKRRRRRRRRRWWKKEVMVTTLTMWMVAFSFLVFVFALFYCLPSSSKCYTTVFYHFSDFMFLLFSI